MWKRCLALVLLCGCALALTGCSKHAKLGEGRLYYTVEEAGCTRIEWTDVDGIESHHVLGQLPKRDEFSDRNVNEDVDVARACDSKYVSAPCIYEDGCFMLCLFGQKHPAVCLYNLATGQQEGKVEASGKFSKPVFGENCKQFIYTRFMEDERCHLFVQDYPKPPREILKTRAIDGAVYNYVDKYIYYSDVSLDGYICLRRCKLDGSDVSDVKTGVSQPAFPRVGHELVGLLEGQLVVYNFYTKTKGVLDSEIGVHSPCWGPLGNRLAYVRNGAIFTVAPGDDPVQVNTPNKKVVDVFWAKGLD